LNLTPPVQEKFFSALQATGLPEVPGEFSVVAWHQVVPNAILAEIGKFVRAFDRVTARSAWQTAACRNAPGIVQLRRSEVCFFSAWDFHLPPDGGFKLIEFNDNGSGFVFAAIINALYHDATGLRRERRIAAPLCLRLFYEHIGNLVEQEAKLSFGELPADVFLILDDAESLDHGRFRQELWLLRDLFEQRGWRAELAAPADLCWDGRQLLFKGKAISFVVNRSTDFLWQSDDFSALKCAYEKGRIYIAPNPFTYATRSDKRLLEWLSLPRWDEELGIEAFERQIFSAHVPETHLVRGENLEMLAQNKHDFVFKPLHGFAGRGLLDSSTVGRARLRHLVKHADGYVAQRRVPKPFTQVDGAPIWTDLRVWAYRGEIFLLSGRASRRLDRLELTAPGGWVPTYSSL
jgi:hypothetical protein